MKENALIDFLCFVVETIDLSCIFITYLILTFIVRLFRLLLLGYQIQ
jgi:hypothetical protein